MSGAAAPGPRRPDFVRWTPGLVNRLVRLTDMVALLLPPLALLLWGLAPPPLTPLQGVLLLAIQLWALFGVMDGLTAYRVEHYRVVLPQLGHIALAATAAAGAWLLALQAIRPGLPLRGGWAFDWHAAQFAALALGRVVSALWLRAVSRRKLLRRDVVVVGVGSTPARVLERLEDPARAEEFRVLGLFSHVGNPEAIGNRRVDGDIAALEEFARTNTVDLVVLCVPWSRAPEIFQLQERLQAVAADIVVPFDLDAPAPPHANLTRLGGLPSVQLMSRPFKGSEAVIKVIEDYTVAILALIVTAPIMLLAAIAIRLDGPGPILFRQPRTGFGGQTFHILKFRTMMVDPGDDGSVGTRTRHDPRITRVGGFLRRSSIDELPQLLNVLRGEMSIVGPRPYVGNMLVGDERFANMIRTFAQRHRIKPGLTGWAQANGMRSAALRDPENAKRSVEMDIWYILNWSLWLDIRIMARTLVVGLAGRNVF